MIIPSFNQSIIKSDNLVLLNELNINLQMATIERLTLLVLAFHSLWWRPNARSLSLRNSLWWPNYIINSVDIRKLFYEYPTETHHPISIETYPLHHYISLLLNQFTNQLQTVIQRMNP